MPQSRDVLTSSARTATTNSADQTNPHYKRVHVIFDVTVVSGTPSLTAAVQGKDLTSGKYYTLVTGAAVTATGTQVLKVGPGFTVTANVSVADALPEVWRVTVTHGTSDSVTYSVGSVMIE